MFAFLRKHQFALLVIVAVVGIAFFVFPDSSSLQPRFARQSGSIKVLGTTFSGEEQDAIRQNIPIIQALSGGYNFQDPMFQYLMRISAATTPRIRSLDDREQQEKQMDFVINTAMTRVLARQMGISASEAEINERIQELPNFQTEQKFDPVKWSNFIDAFGGEAGARRKAIYRAVGDSIIFGKLFALVGEKIPASQEELNLTYAQQNQRVTASVVTLAKKDFENQEITEDELKAYYDKHKDSPELFSDEKRSIHYTLIAKPKPEDLKDLDEAKKAEKEKEYKKTAAAFSERLVAEDRGQKKFDAIAAELNLEVKTAGPFTQAELPNELKTKFQLTRILFAIPEAGRSEVVEAPEGYYAVEVSAIEEPKPLAFEDAKEKITALLKTQKQDEKFAEFVKTSREKIQAAVSEGKPFTEAVKEAGVTAEAKELAAFSQKKPLAGEPNAFQIASAAHKTDIGQVSEPVDVADGKLLVFVAKKELPKDPKMEDDKKALASRQAMSADEPSNNPVFFAWFNKMRDQADAALGAR